MRVLVTGGTGYLGQAVVRALARRGHDVVIFARRASAGAARAALPGYPIDGDIRDRDAVFAAARGMDAICHTAALVSIWHPDPGEFDRVNVGGLQHVLDAAASLRIPRIVYTSSFLALPPAGRHRPVAGNAYQQSKVRARTLARRAAARGAPIVTVVPGVVYGPGPDSEGNLVAAMIRDHLAGRLPGLIGASRTWSFAFVEDVAEGHVLAAERGGPGEEYALGGENVPQVRLFELLREATGCPLPRRIPPVAAWFAAWVEERAARRRPPRLTRRTVRILLHDWPLDSGRSAIELSYRVTALKTGLSRLIHGRA